MQTVVLIARNVFLLFFAAFAAFLVSIKRSVGLGLLIVTVHRTFFRFNLLT